MDRHATATWKGSLKEGNGTFTAQSGAFTDLPYSFRTRFESEPGTNPEELIAAAHAACFSMALSAQLGAKGVTPDAVETRATVTLETVDGKPTVTKSHLDVAVRAADAQSEAIKEAADEAKAGCPISRLLNAEVSMSLTIGG